MNESNTVPKDWPSKGQIEFKNFDMSYSSGSQLVLKNINFKILSKQKVGVVGRTGMKQKPMSILSPFLFYFLSIF